MALTVVDATRLTERDPEAPIRPAGQSTWSRVDLALAGLVALPLVLWTVAIVTATHAWLAQNIPDDAYYYLEIGERLKAGQGPTFDGIHLTNGFHPLWQGIVAVLAVAFSGDLLVKAALVLSLVLVATSAALLVRSLEKRYGRRAALVGVAVALHAGGLGLVVNGMETPLVLLAVALLVTAIDTRGASTPDPGDTRGASAAVVGLACAGVALARVDFLIVLPLVPLALGWWSDRRTLLRWALGFGAPVLPVALANFIAFGMPLSVSGTLKLHWISELATSQGGWLSSGYRSVVGQAAGDYRRMATEVVATPAASLLPPWSSTVHLVGGGALILGLVLIVRSIRRTPRRGVEIVLGLLLLKALVDVTVLPLWATGWYAGPVVVLGVATAVAAIAAQVVQARQSLVVRAWALMLVFLFALPAGLPHTHLDRVDATIWQGGADEVATWLRAHPLDGRIGAYDSGLLGFELHPTPVVNLDGLVNDADFARAVIAGATPEQRLERTGVAYLVGRFPDDDPRVPACAREVWRSPELVAYADVSTAATYAAIRVLDVRCATS
jgi:hypothetical protein